MLNDNKMSISVNAADFGGAPLFKKFAMFDSGLVPMPRYRRDMYRFDNVAPHSLRADLFIGEDKVAFGNAVTGDAKNMIYDFSDLDELAVLLHDHGVLPYYSWCYIPKPLQIGNDHRSGPCDLDAYGEMLEHFAEHYKEAGIRLGYQEVYNEPDCFDVFFTGKYEDYIKMYEVGAPALKRGDPDAVVGGPSTAFVYGDGIQKENFTKFLASVVKNKLPLDFFSFHSYGHENSICCHRTEMVREALNGEPYFQTTELHMNELNVVPGPWGYRTAGGKMLCSRKMLGLIFNSIRELSEYTDLTLVHWAQLLDSGVDALGLVDAEGKVRPAYAAFEIYARMPVRRIKTEDKNGIKVMASADLDRVSIVLQVGDGASIDISSEISGIPFENGTVSVFVLNEEFFKEYDGALKPSFEFSLGEKMPVVTLSEDDIIYIEINSSEPKNEAKTEKAHKYIRTHYYFDDRSKNTASWYDERLGVTYLGMGENEKGIAVCASEIETAKNKLIIDLKSADIRSDDGCLAFKIDFATDDGYKKSVLYTNDPECELPYLPFGTKREADETVICEIGNIEVDLLRYAPSEWRGRILVTSILKDGGADSWIEMEVK